MDYCSVCANVSHLMCQRCFEPYCSVMCQRNDWQEHKKICFPMPLLVGKPEMNVQRNVDPRRNMDKATATLNDLKLNGRNPLEEKVSNFPNEFKQKPDAIKPTMTPQKRVETMTHQPKEVVRSLSAAAAQPSTKPSQTITPMQSTGNFIAMREPQISSSATSQIPIVTVPVPVDPMKSRPVSAPVTANGNANASALTTNIKSRFGMLMMGNRFKIDAIKMVPLPEGENVKLICIDKSDVMETGRINCFADIVKFQEFETKWIVEIDKYCKSGPPRNFEPEPNDLCFVIFEADNSWSRAVCLNNLNDGTYKIKFIDYGNTAIVDKSKILNFNGDFLFDCLVNPCIIEGTTKSLDEIIIALDKDPRFKANVKRVGDEFQIQMI